MSLYFNGKNFVEFKYLLEADFEGKVFDDYKPLFGKDTILNGF